MDIITSANNNYVKRLKLLSTKKGRGRFGEFIIEGQKYVENISDDWDIKLTVVSESFYSSGQGSACPNVIILRDNVFSMVSDTVTPQGMLAVIGKRAYSYNDIKAANPLLVIAHNLQDPGNMGTLIRTADAAGAAGVIVSGGSVDIYNPKVVRATAGSILNIPIIHDEEADMLKWLKSNNIQVISTHLRAEKSLYEVDFTGPSAIIIGNESKGLPDDLADMCDNKIKIPMAGMAESLNASVASAVVMYEALRQRLL